MSSDLQETVRPGVTPAAAFADELIALEPAKRQAKLDSFEMRLRMMTPAGEQATAIRAERLIGKVQSLAEVEIKPVEYLFDGLANRLVYRDGLTAFSGHPESGKSTVVYALGLGYIRAGGCVLHFDYEAGEADAKARLVALGATDAELERWHYLAWPALDDWSQVEELWDEHPGAAGVWDSMKGALDALGLDEDRAKDVIKLTTPLGRVSKTRGVANLLIDHSTKAQDGSGRYASRGSGAKLADVEAEWYVDKKRDFSQSEAGEVHLIRKKQRRGGLRSFVALAVGDAQGGLPIRELDAGEAETSWATARRVVLAYMAERPGERLSRTAIEEAVQGRGAGTEAVRNAVTALGDDEDAPLHAKPEGRCTYYVYDEARVSGSFGLPI